MNAPLIWEVGPPYDAIPRTIPETDRINWQIHYEQIEAMDFEPVEKLIEFGVGMIRENGCFRLINLELLHLPMQYLQSEETRQYIRAAVEKYPLIGVLLHPNAANSIIGITLTPISIRKEGDRTLYTYDPFAVKDLVYRFLWAAEERWVLEFEPMLVGMLTYWAWNNLKGNIREDIC